MEDLVFEFSAPIAATMLDSLANTLEQMGDDAASYIKQASQNEQAAAANEAAAASELATIPNYKEITVEETDEDGEVHEKKERVPDLVADAAARAAAWAFQQAAAALRAIAASLIGTASSLQCSITDGTRQKQQLSIGIENTQFAIKTTGNLLVDGLGLIKEVTSAFNVPQTDNKVEWAKNVGSNLLKIVGVDLSDGLNDEIYTAIGIGTQLAVIAGTVALDSAVSIIGTQMGVGILGNIGRQALKIESQKIKDKYLNQTGAKVTQNKIASALTLKGINALPTLGKNLTVNAATLDRTKQSSQMTFEEAKTDAKEKYAKYVAKLGCYTEEQKKDLINKYNEQIDKVEVLSDDEFWKQIGNANPATVAYYNGPKDKVYISEKYAGNTDILIHEIGGHGTGSMSTTEGYYYTDQNTGESVLYTGTYEDSSTKLTWMGNYSGIGEATTEFFTRKINGEKSEGCIYNSSVDALESILNTMTKYGGVNAEELLFETYTSDDKEKFAKKYNQMMGSDEAYNLLDEEMRLANYGDPAYEKLVGINAGLFKVKNVIGY